jgi:hypothetical protein
VFRLLAQADPDCAVTALDALSEEYAAEIRPEALEPLLTHADSKVREAGLSLVDRVGRDGRRPEPVGAR